MTYETLSATIEVLAQAGKGILAADESVTHLSAAPWRDRDHRLWHDAASQRDGYGRGDAGVARCGSRLRY